MTPSPPTPPAYTSIASDGAGDDGRGRAGVSEEAGERGPSVNRCLLRSPFGAPGVRVPPPRGRDDGVELRDIAAPSRAPRGRGRSRRRAPRGRLAAVAPAVHGTGRPTTRLHRLDHSTSPRCGVPVPRLNTADARAAFERVQRQHVRLREVADVNVVAQAGAVRRGIVRRRTPASGRAAGRRAESPAGSGESPARGPRRSRRPDPRRRR